MNSQSPPTGYETPVPQEPPQPAVRLTPVVVAPTVTYILIGITGFVFLAQMASGQIIGFDLPQSLGLKVNELIAAGQFWRLFTPMLLHGSILHFLFNMYALYVFGRSLEPYYGHIRFLALYIIGGFAGNVFSMIFTTAPSLGASTAIFGLLGAEGVFLYQNRGMLGKGGRRALNNLIGIAVLNLVIGLSPQIDNWGHMGGLIAGLLFGWFAGPVMEVRGYPPDVSLADARHERQVITTGLAVAALFAILAAVTIILRM